MLTIIYWQRVFVIALKSLNPHQSLYNFTHARDRFTSTHTINDLDCSSYPTICVSDLKIFRFHRRKETDFRQQPIRSEELISWKKRQRLHRNTNAEQCSTIDVRWHACARTYSLTTATTRPLGLSCTPRAHAQHTTLRAMTVVRGDAIASLPLPTRQRTTVAPKICATPAMMPVDFGGGDPPHHLCTKENQIGSVENIVHWYIFGFL